eukprot:jgi/Tetstr1/420989/TSEL_012049.t1
MSTAEVSEVLMDLIPSSSSSEYQKTAETAADWLTGGVAAFRDAFPDIVDAKFKWDPLGKLKDKCRPAEYSPSKEKADVKLKITGPKLTISYKPVKCIVEDKKMITCYPGALVVKKEPGVIEKPSKYTSTTFKDRECVWEKKLTKMSKHVLIKAPSKREHLKAVKKKLEDHLVGKKQTSIDYKQSLFEEYADYVLQFADEHLSSADMERVVRAVDARLAEELDHVEPGDVTHYANVILSVVEDYLSEDAIELLKSYADFRHDGLTESLPNHDYVEKYADYVYDYVGALVTGDDKEFILDRVHVMFDDADPDSIYEVTDSVASFVNWYTEGDIKSHFMTFPEFVDRWPPG